MGIESDIYGLSSPQDQFSEPFALQMANLMPPAWATTGWNLGRVSRTMRAAGRTGGRGGILEGINQTANPRYLRRLRRAANIDPTAYGAEAKIYSPFNFLSSTGNFLFSKRDTNVPLVGKRANSLISKASGSLSGKLGLQEGDIPFSPGTLGRIMGMNDIANMSSRSFAKNKASMLANVGDLMNAAPEAFAYGDDIVGRYAMASRFGSTIGGKISGKAAGYIHGASAYKEAAKMGGKDALRNFASEGRQLIHAAGKETSGFFREGFDIGLKAAEEGKFLAKVSPYAAPALRGINVASWILLAHDAALGVGKVVGAATKGIIETGKSTMGSINKPIMGMGFKDNTVAATSRQRGVMAIQNSQLNARSILGSEGAMMAAHFG